MIGLSARVTRWWARSIRNDTDLRLDVEASRIGGAVVAERHAEAGQQLRSRERLRDVVVSAVVEDLDLAILGVVGGEHDDRNVRPRANPPAQLDTVDVREPQIENDRRRARTGHDVDRLIASGGRHDAIAACAEGGGKHAGDRRFVVDDEHEPILSHGAPAP